MIRDCPPAPGRTVHTNGEVIEQHADRPLAASTPASAGPEDVSVPVVP